MIGNIFIGPVRHWTILAVIVAAVWYMGRQQFHITYYKLFTSALLVLSLAAVGFVVWTYKRGERITREPITDNTAGGNNVSSED